MKRFIDIAGALTGLIILSPILVFISLGISIMSGYPILFSQIRMGKNNREFLLYKFRTMQVMKGTEQGSFEAGHISRITPIGRILRKWKLDEIPQLWNVLKGDMSLVGPRPEIREWTKIYPERWANVLKIKPGITDPASIEFRNEQNLLGQARDPYQLYKNEILPKKLSIYENYVHNQSTWQDMMILCETVFVILR